MFIGIRKVRVKISRSHKIGERRVYNGYHMQTFKVNGLEVEAIPLFSV
jgi:hypothetical protein